MKAQEKYELPDPGQDNGRQKWFDSLELLLAGMDFGTEGSALEGAGIQHGIQVGTKHAEPAARFRCQPNTVFPAETGSQDAFEPAD